MTSGFGGGPFGPDPFEEFLARFFGAAPRQPVRRIDLARLMSQEARELLHSVSPTATSSPT